MSPYLLIMAFAGVIILSFFFNIIAEKTNIPSVLMLIGLGMGIKAFVGSDIIGDDTSQMESLLEVLGNIGLVMIVLEAALDLKLEKKKAPLIFKSLIIESLVLVVLCLL